MQLQKLDSVYNGDSKACTTIFNWKLNNRIKWDRVNWSNGTHLLLCLYFCTHYILVSQTYYVLILRRGNEIARRSDLSKIVTFPVIFQLKIWVSWWFWSVLDLYQGFLGQEVKNGGIRFGGFQWFPVTLQYTFLRNILNTSFRYISKSKIIKFHI